MMMEVKEKFFKAIKEKYGKPSANPLFKKRKINEKRINREYERWIKENEKFLKTVKYKEVLTLKEFYEKYTSQLIEAVKRREEGKEEGIKRLVEFLNSLNKLLIYDDLVSELSQKYLNLKIKFIDPLIFIL